jgi:hypothetical protein
MAYCPSCGREQRCGCAECHSCGVRLVDKRPNPTGVIEPARRESVRDTIGPVRMPAENGQEEQPPQIQQRPSPAIDASSIGARLIPAALLAIGIAVLVVGVVEIIHTASGLSGQGVMVTGSVRRVGYFLGGLLYLTSVRALVGFALLTLSLLLSPHRPFRRESTWRGAASGVGLAMLITGFLYVLSMILMLLPGSDPSAIVRGLTPGLPGAILVLLSTGLALIVAGRLVAVVAPASLSEEHEATWYGEQAEEQPGPGWWHRLSEKITGRKS